ncbi:hypothetical protein KP509_39G018700 [Ceratopteris richardii]|nr:hypothetical protein KP509_39G018700 [Ceratopteris richardii]
MSKSCGMERKGTTRECAVGRKVGMTTWADGRKATTVAKVAMRVATVREVMARDIQAIPTRRSVWYVSVDGSFGVHCCSSGMHVYSSRS